MHTHDLPENQPASMTDSQMIAFFTDLIRRRAAVTLARTTEGWQARAAWPWLGRGSYLLGEGRTLAHAVADMKTEDELHAERAPESEPGSASPGG